MIKEINFKNNLGINLKGFIHIPKKYDTAILHLHGFPGAMFGTSKRMCDVMSKAGFLAMRFEFSGTNTSGGKFQDKLISQEVREIKYAIDYLYKNFNFKKLILTGISTGAIDASLYAYKDKRINKLVLISGVSKLDEAVHYDFSDKQIKSFWEKGYIIYNSPGVWVHRKKLDKRYYDEFFKLNIPVALKKFKKPILIIHGTNDTAVPAQKDPQELYKLANKPKKLVLIKGADHSFTSKNHWDKLIKEIKNFIK